VAACLQATESTIVSTGLLQQPQACDSRMLLPLLTSPLSSCRAATPLHTHTHPGVPHPRGETLAPPRGATRQGTTTTTTTTTSTSPRCWGTSLLGAGGEDDVAAGGSDAWIGHPLIQPGKGKRAVTAPVDPRGRHGLRDVLAHAATGEVVGGSGWLGAGRSRVGWGGVGEAVGGGVVGWWGGQCRGGEGQAPNTRQAGSECSRTLFPLAVVVQFTPSV
jgi:hypothetical protein